MPDFTPIRACIFDVDGLLINSEDIYSLAMNNVLREYGKPDCPWDVKAIMQSRSRTGHQNFMEWAKLPISVDEFKAKIDAQRHLFRDSQLNPGVAELLYNLCTRAMPKVRLAIATSAERDFFKIKTDKFSDVLAAIPEHNRIFGDDPSIKVAKGKPAPDIFLQSLERLNQALSPGEISIKPEECLVFEDSTAGVEAGRKAGMRVMWVPQPEILEVYRGREELVLAGAGDERDRFGMFPAGGYENYLPFSKDGWAEVRATLKDFPYEHYGIKLLDKRY